MSEKARDGHGRWRSKTIAFRISPEENTMLEDFVRLSGLTKQEYIIQRVLNREVVVYGNPRVHRALKNKMEELCHLVANMPNVNYMDPETAEVMRSVAIIYRDLGAEK